ncbi:class I SAM-dependent methyltransferase [Pseudonocardia sp.]|uniref:class I SAM-dependent methyltransferase n=1 Tax=Pseudonocardia sp. TaxID=60912 RepID=UPI003D0CFAC3
MTRVNGATLDGVSATALWTLRNRAAFAVGPRPLIEDPYAVRAHGSIDYDWDRFGPPSQSHPLRALALDEEIGRYLAHRPGATVVALGEGLQTTFWRVGAPRARWLSVDLAPVMDARAALFPTDDDRMVPLSMSALDLAWLDEVQDPSAGVFVSAEGLFMYLERDDVLALVAECARRFPGGRLLFDSIPPWFSRRTLKGLKLTPRYTAPGMPTAFTPSQTVRVFEALPGVASVRSVDVPLGRGLWGSRILRSVASLPPVREFGPSIALLSLAG